MTGLTALIDRLLAEIFPGFPKLHGKCHEICAQPSVLPHYHLPTDITDVTLRASDRWKSTWTGTGGTATLAKSFLLQPMAPWIRGLKNIVTK